MLTLWKSVPGIAFSASGTAAGTVVAVTVTILELITSSFAAYAFARLRFPGRDKLFLLYLGTLMIPGQVTIIPNFLLISWLGWVDTYAALIIPAAFSAFGTFLLRQFFLSIPPELEQAARMDGCSYFGIYRHIILPLSGPALATLAVFTAAGQTPQFNIMKPSTTGVPCDEVRLMGFDPAGNLWIEGRFVYWQEAAVAMLSADQLEQHPLPGGGFDTGASLFSREGLKTSISFHPRRKRG